MTEEYAAGIEEAFSRFDSGENILGLIRFPGTGIKVASNGFLHEEILELLGSAG